MSTVELRVEGEAGDVESTVAWLKACFKVVKESKPYIDRPRANAKHLPGSSEGTPPSRNVRVYVEMQAEPPPNTEGEAGG